MMIVEISANISDGLMTEGGAALVYAVHISKVLFTLSGWNILTYLEHNSAGRDGFCSKFYSHKALK